MQLSYKRMENWPRLAWIARLVPSERVIQVMHGPDVETNDQWFCEAAWCGDFSAGDFDRTERVFGSGLRIRDNVVTFVSSGSTLDRLIWAQRRDATYVSNSLP